MVSLVRKFYIIKNNTLLEAFERNKKIRNTMHSFNADFFRRYGFEGKSSTIYLTPGGRDIIYLTDENCDNIEVRIQDTPNNRDKLVDQIEGIGNGFLFVKNNAKVKHDLCLAYKESQIPIFVPGNILLLKELITELDMAGNYFIEHFIGQDGNYYFSLILYNFYDYNEPGNGFIPVKGSDYFKALESLEESGVHTSWSYHGSPAMGKEVW